MRRFIVALALGSLFVPLSLGAQKPATVARIGLLCAVTCPGAYLAAEEGRAFLEGLSELGYLEGQNIVLDIRASGASYDRLPGLADELVRRRVDVILALEGSAAARAAKNATRAIPVVMVGVPDAVELGLVGSLARPGGNVTGLTLPFAELVAKQLELLGEVVPEVSRIAVLWNPANPEHGPALKGIEKAARRFGVELQPLEMRSFRESEAAFSAMSRGRAGGLLVLPDPTFGMARIPLLAINGRIPTISLRREFASGGGLMTYGPSVPHMYRRAAFFVDRILKGAKPADLPVEEPMQFEMVINLTTAKALGLTIPESVLTRADEVIR